MCDCHFDGGRSCWVHNAPVTEHCVNSHLANSIDADMQPKCSLHLPPVAEKMNETLTHVKLRHAMVTPFVNLTDGKDFKETPV